MAQHFLLSSNARTLSLASVMRMSDLEAEQMFAHDWRQADLPALLRLGDLRRSPQGRFAALPLKAKGMRRFVFAHVEDVVRFPQAALAHVSFGDRHLLQR